jgi:acetyltransferase
MPAHTIIITLNICLRLRIGRPGYCYNDIMETKTTDKIPDLLDLSTYRENWTSRDGKSVILRSITSKDKRIEKELIDGLSLQSARYRFFHVIKEATEEMVDKFCDIDYTNEVAIIAEYNATVKARNVGVVRLFIDPNLQTGEFAILVADNFQGSGLGTKFMLTLIDIAQKKSLRSIYGIVLAENSGMLTLAKEFGFSIGAVSDGEVKITRQL